jgi:hypothetical protein
MKRKMTMAAILAEEQGYVVLNPREDADRLAVVADIAPARARKILDDLAADPQADEQLPGSARVEVDR